MTRRIRRTWWLAYTAFMIAGVSIIYATTTVEPLLPHEQRMFRVDNDPPVYPETNDT